jgi:hypothetical protein
MFGSTSKESRINLQEKFDGTHSKNLGFVNQIYLIMQLHQHRYPNDRTQVRLLGTLLSYATLTWFTPILDVNLLF